MKKFMKIDGKTKLYLKKEENCEDNDATILKNI